MKKRTLIIVTLFFLSFSISMTLPVISEEIKFVTYNVWFGIDGHGTLKMGEYEYPSTRAKRYELLISGLKGLDPDIICLQETNKLPAYAKRVGRDIGYDVVWKIVNSGIKILGHGIPVNFTEGDTILARKEYDLEYIGAKRLSGSGIQSDLFCFHMSEVRYVSVGLVEISGRPLLVFNAHTHSSIILNDRWIAEVDEMYERGEITADEKDEMLLEMEESHNRTESDVLGVISFVQEITEKNDYPYVIMGDFNTTPESPAIQELISELGLLDPYAIMNPGDPCYTWNVDVNTNTAFDDYDYWADGRTPKAPIDRLWTKFGREENLRLDFIFLSHHFSPEMITEARIIFDEPVDGLFISDHFGVEVVVDRIPE